MAGVERGAGVALDPRDGGILALVSRPSFDPNEFSRGLSFARWRQMSAGGAEPLLDRALQGVYPPGSTFKIITMLAAMRHDVAGPRQHMPVSCAGGYQFGARWFGCWEKRGHGSLDLTGALEHSCDTYFYQTGIKLGLANLSGAARDFGFGERTGIDLPQERRGLMPDDAYYDKRFGAGRWPRGVLLNLAIGQGEILATPLQLAIMVAEAANAGKPVRPHVVKEVRGDPSFRVPPPSHAGIEGSQEEWDAVREAMRRVVESGTARAARVPGVLVGGKTGTAQNPHGDDHALFVAVAPLDSPRIAMAFVIENSGHGGSVAAPMAGHVLRRMFLPDSMQVPFGRPLPVVAAARRDTVAAGEAVRAD
jgi:penicillin-binding protein 2